MIFLIFLLSNFKSKEMRSVEEEVDEYLGQIEELKTQLTEVELNGPEYRDLLDQIRLVEVDISLAQCYQ